MLVKRVLRWGRVSIDVYWFSERAKECNFMRPSLIFCEQVNLQSGQLAITISSFSQRENGGSLLKKIVMLQEVYS